MHNLCMCSILLMCFELHLTYIFIYSVVWNIRTCQRMAIQYFAYSNREWFKFHRGLIISTRYCQLIKTTKHRYLLISNGIECEIFRLSMTSRHFNNRQMDENIFPSLYKPSHPTNKYIAYLVYVCSALLICMCICECVRTRYCVCIPTSTQCVATSCVPVDPNNGIACS